MNRKISRINQTQRLVLAGLAGFLYVAPLHAETPAPAHAASVAEAPAQLQAAGVSSGFFSKKDRASVVNERCTFITKSRNFLG
jgi:hypothetical protein